MLPALNGRINRKTYIIANLIALALLGVACAVIVVPVAILDIAANGTRISDVLSIFYYAVILPVFLYAFYFSVLMVKRAHDFNSPGILWVAAFFALQIISRYFDLFTVNLISLGILAFFCIKAGSKTRNNFGPSPREQFRLKDIKVTF
jgi:uncharacterized membrane protein YhaH (DUF805 family)